LRDDVGRAFILTELRERTRSEHAALEQALGLDDAALTAQLYTRVIVQLYGFWRPLEDRLRALGGLRDCGYDLGQRGKSELLGCDLRALGELDPFSLPLCRDLPDPTSVAAAFGCAYVMEGATLGGQIVSRSLKAHLGITPERGGRFFHGYGTETATMWRAFGVSLSTFEQTLADREPIVVAAIDTFRSLRLWHARSDGLDTLAPCEPREQP
jgi:heme oxygenase